MESKRVKLFNLIDLDNLINMQQALAGICGTTSLIIDTNGDMFTEITNAWGICALELASSNGFINFKTVLNKLIEKVRLSNKTDFIYNEKSSLITVAVPIFHNSEYIGSWVIAQIRLEDQNDENKLIEYAKTYGISHEEAVKAANEIPVITKQRYNEIINLYESICKNLAAYAILSSEADEKAGTIDTTTQVLMKFVNSFDVGMFVADYYSGEILLVNEKVADIVHADMYEMTGKNAIDYFDPENKGQCFLYPSNEAFKEAESLNEPYIWENYVQAYGLWLKMTNQAIYWLDGRLAHMVSFVDITQAKRLQVELSQLAFCDRETGILNGLKLSQDMNDATDIDAYSFVFFDIFSLRKINDAYGRKAGDSLIISLVEWIKGMQLGYQSFYRLDGDAFCLSFKNIRPKKVEKIARNIYERFEEPWNMEMIEENFHIFCSITLGVIHGVEVHAEDNFQNLMVRTLEVARDTGTMAIYTEEVNEKFKSHLMLELSLRNCVKEGMCGFDVYYQPIVDPLTGIWVGVEALCRWNSPEFGVIPPTVFIKEAEQLGLIETIGAWVMHRAVSDCKNWGLDKIEHFLLDVNISASQLIANNFIDFIGVVLKKYDYPGGKLALEITESMEFNLDQHTSAIIYELRQMGCKVALDDFGTGYSSFNLLKSLPVHLLKTERVFLENIENDSYLQYLLYLIVELAHAADMKIVAEGVENEEQMRFLIRNSVDFVQGYLFSKPLPPKELSKNLDNFYKSNMDLSNMIYSKGELKKMMSLEGAYSISPLLYNTLNCCIQILLQEGELNHVVSEVLKYLGEQLAIGRAYVLLDSAQYPVDNKFVWTGGGIVDSSDTFANIAKTKAGAKMLSYLYSDGIFVASDVSFVDKDICADMEKKGIHSVCIFPFFEKDTIFGILCMDTQGIYHNWVADEVIMFHNLSTVMTNVFRKDKLQREVISHSIIMDTILDNMEVGVCVSDMETNEFLFTNKIIGDIFNSAENYKTGTCYNTIYGKNEPCADCMTHEPFADSIPKQKCKEIYNRNANKYYNVYDSIIPWLDHKKAHLEYVVDVTAIKGYQMKIESLTALSTQTIALEKHTLAARLIVAIGENINRQDDLSLCVLRFEGLDKLCSEPDGEQSKAVIKKTEQLLLNSIRKEDILGRYDENTYIVALVNCAENVVRVKMTRLSNQYKEMMLPYHNSAVLSYGCILGSTVEGISAEQDIYKTIETVAVNPVSSGLV